MAMRHRNTKRLWLALAVWSVAGLSAAQEPAGSPVAPGAQPVRIEAVPVELNSLDPAVKALGDFAYAGGLWLTSKQTNRFRELSDIVVTGQDRLLAVGDGGALFGARLVFGADRRLIGLADTSLAQLMGEDGKPLTDVRVADAEGLAILGNGDRLVSFEHNHRIWLYPAGGGWPRAVPSPVEKFPLNFGMEALAADPSAGPDAYVVGEEMTGKTWTCRLTTACVPARTVEKPGEFGLVAINRLDQDRWAYLLRAYDPFRGNRNTLQVLRSTTIIAQMDLASPLTVDNFEGLASVPLSDGGIRFYLISDNNGSSSQRTLLLAFDWRPRVPR
jgi:hypothetical protein